MSNKFLDDNKDTFYLIFRLVIGLLFFLHGAQKFGILNGTFSIPDSGFLILLAAIIEVVAGILIFWGAFVRKAAVVSGIVMLYAFFVVHALSLIHI